MALGSVGVVYGDIGTSPLYGLREAVIAASDNHAVTRATVLGVLSLILWALLITVTAKYVLILLRADNNGEGGTLSLTALASRALGRRTTLVFIIGIIGASMFLGDSVITPAISVLSAVEGLKLASPAFAEYVAPLAVVILIGLVRRAKPRHRQGGLVLRAGHGGVVHFAGDRRRAAHQRRPQRALPRSIRCTASNSSSGTASSAW